MSNCFLERILNLTVEELDFSVRSYICLKRAGINTVNDLVQKTSEELSSIEHLADKSYAEIIRKLASLGFVLRNENGRECKNFVDLYYKLAIVLDDGYCFDTFKMMQEKLDSQIVPRDIKPNSALIYGYMDKTFGLSYRVLGLTYYEDGDYTLVWPNDNVGLTVRGDSFKCFEIIPIENKALLKRYFEEIQIINSAYLPNDVENI